MKKIILLFVAILFCGAQMMAQFKLYDAVFHHNDWQHKQIYLPYLQGFIIGYNSSTNGSEPYPAGLKYYAGYGVADPSCLVGFDVEPTWPSYPSESFNTVVNNFLRIVDTFRIYDNVSKVGFYATPPYQAYGWDGVNSTYAKPGYDTDRKRRRLLFAELLLQFGRHGEMAKVCGYQHSGH